MGLLTGIILLPLAPVRGTAWIAERLLEQAELEQDGERQLRLRLQELQVAHELGEIDDDEYERSEDALLAELDLRRTELPPPDDEEVR